jgi:hypothetical protein
MAIKESALSNFRDLSITYPGAQSPILDLWVQSEAQTRRSGGSLVND